MYIYTCVYIHTTDVYIDDQSRTHSAGIWYEWVLSACEVATISRLPKNIGLFCTRALQNRSIFCKKDFFKEPTNHSHPIADLRRTSFNQVKGRPHRSSVSKNPLGAARFPQKWSLSFIMHSWTLLVTRVHDYFCLLGLLFVLTTIPLLPAYLRDRGHIDSI